MLIIHHSEWGHCIIDARPRLIFLWGSWCSITLIFLGVVVNRSDSGMMTRVPFPMAIVISLYEFLP